MVSFKSYKLFKLERYKLCKQLKVRFHTDISPNKYYIYKYNK